MSRPRIIIKPFHLKSRAGQAPKTSSETIIPIKEGSIIFLISGLSTDRPFNKYHTKTKEAPFRLGKDEAFIRLHHWQGRQALSTIKPHYRQAGQALYTKSANYSRPPHLQSEPAYKHS